MENLHEKFVELGSSHRKIVNKLLAILPEIYSSGIYKKYAGTIVEYAGKYGGLSKRVVMKRLNLEKRLEDKPILRKLIETEGVHKVALVASIAKPETEKIWADKVVHMSKASLSELAKEIRGKDPEENKCRALPQKIKLELDEEMTFLFLKLKKQLKEKDNKCAMKKILQMLTEETPAVSEPSSKAIKPTRYIPAEIKRATISRTKGKCAYPNCNKTIDQLHHPKRWATHKNHNQLVGLCKTHHEFMHNGLIPNESAPAKHWKLIPGERFLAEDIQYRKIRLLAKRNSPCLT